jgi:glucose 1-dehydrogenase
MAKAILVTGSSQGIGFGISKFFAEQGFHVYINYSSDDTKAVQAMAELSKIGASASLHKADVTNEGSVVTLCEAIKDSGHTLESVVVNAVDEIPKPVDEATLVEWHKVLLTKLDGAFLITKYCIPLLQKAENPSLTYITSADGVRPNGEYLAYQVGTAGLIAMSIAHSKYLAKKYGIRVNSVSPGPVRSGLWDKAGQSEKMWQDFALANPTGRVATSEDVGRAVWTLAQDPLKFLNGTTIHVDGGSQWN